jgi:AbrB family looped-hinge helix DNA binding protein
MEMVVKIDKLGRIVLPKNLREKMNIQPDDELIIIEQKDGLIIKPKPAKRSLKSIFDNGSKFDPKKVVKMDLSNSFLSNRETKDHPIY